MRILGWFRDRRARIRREKQLLEELPEGAVPGFTDELFVQTDRHHRKEQRRAQ